MTSARVEFLFSARLLAEQPEVEALRRIEHISGDKLVIDLPKPFLDRQVEVIIVAVDDVAASKARPALPAGLKHSVNITDDLLEPAVDPSEWEASLERTARQIAGDRDAFG